MFYSYENGLAFLNRVYTTSALLFLVFSFLVPAIAQAQSLPTSFDFDTEGQTACANNENLAPADTLDLIDRLSNVQRETALICEDGVDDAFGSSGFHATFDSTRSAFFKMYNRIFYQG